MDAREAFPAYRSAMQEALSSWAPLGVDAVRLEVGERGDLLLVAESRAPSTTRRSVPPTYDGLPVLVEARGGVAASVPTLPSVTPGKSVRMALPGR